MTMSPALRLAPFAAAALLAACATPAPTPPAVAIPANLGAPAGQMRVRTLLGDGAQIYECRKAAGAVSPDWALVAPKATLFDASGAQVGHHYAGPTWEADDGSKVVGVVQAKADAPQPGAITWLLLATHSTGTPGLFANVTTMQRVATEGGVAPATGCDSTTVGKQVSVPYKAQYVQYVAKP